MNLTIYEMLNVNYSCLWVDIIIIQHLLGLIHRYRLVLWIVRVLIRRQVTCNSHFCPLNEYRAVEVMVDVGLLHLYRRPDMERLQGAPIYR